MWRRPSTLGRFVLLGLWRGALTGAILGTCTGALISIALIGTEDGWASAYLLLILGYGLLVGVVLGAAIGLVVGTITGLFRRHFDALWPVAAATVFLLTVVPGIPFSFVNQFFFQEDEPHRLGMSFVGCAWALGLGAAFALAAGIASIGIHGSKGVGVAPGPVGDPTSSESWRA